jgi:predicted dinucleotide-binding enzyme
MTSPKPIGFLGAGPVAQALSARALAAGLDVALANSRGPDTLAGLIESLGEGASAATLAEVAQLPLVVLAVPWTAAADLITRLGQWNNRILVDATNHFLTTDPPVIDDIGDRVGSQMLADLIPDARLVRAFGSLEVAHYDTGRDEGQGRRAMFISGDDTDATSTVAALADQLGFAAIVLGSLREGRLHQLGGPLIDVQLTRRSAND